MYFASLYFVYATTGGGGNRFFGCLGVYGGGIQLRG